MKLDRNRPYGQTFGADAGAMPIMQDNVYFNTRGEVVDCHYNREHSPQLFAAAVVEEVAPDVPPATPALDPVVPSAPAPAPSVPELLASKTDAEIYTAAVKLRAMLDDAADPDTFVPDPSDKEQNTTFLLRHSGG